MLMEKDVSSVARSCSRKLIAVTFSASLWMMVLVHMVVMGFGNTLAQSVRHVIMGTMVILLGSVKHSDLKLMSGNL